MYSQPTYSMAVNGTAATSVNVTMNTGTVYTNPSGSQWYSANTSIATVNSSTGVVTGVVAWERRD